MSAIVSAWQRFWFDPAPAGDLGLSRLLFFGGLSLIYLTHDFSPWATVSPAHWQPIWLFERPQLPVLPATGLEVVQAVWKLSLLTSCAGLFTRVSMPVAAVLGTYLLGLPHNFGKIHHFDAAIVLACWVLAFSRAGDACSLDRLMRAGRRAAGTHPAPDAEYRWPGQLVLVTLSLVFFAAAIAKLRRSGLEWVFSDHMAILLKRSHYHVSGADPLVSWGGAIAAHAWLARSFAAGALAIELAYPLALFSRALRLPLVLSGIGLILGIRLLMGPTFEGLLLLNVFWVPWLELGRSLRSRFARTGAPARQTARHDVAEPLARVSSAAPPLDLGPRLRAGRIA